MRCLQIALVLTLLVALGNTAAEALSVDEVVKLANQGVGEEVLLATVERADAAFNLTVDQIVKLKQAGVPEKVIAVMLRKKGGGMMPPVEVAPRVQDAAPQAAPDGAAQGTLNVENVDELSWAYRLDPNTRILWIYKPDAKSERLLAPHGGVTLSAPAGAYEVRYVGEENSNPLSVVAGQTSLVLVSRVDTQDFEGLYISVFEQGERKGGGRLAILRQAPRRTIGQPQATYQYLPSKTTESEPQTQTVQQTVVEPATTVIYRPAPGYAPGAYYGPSYYPYSPYYGPSPYYPWNRVLFRYGNGHYHRSGLSVGFGFGF
jgi:hypothetical protein